MSSLRIFVADNQEIVRRIISALIAFRPEWEVCGEADNGTDAVKRVAQLKPDIVLIDVDLAKVNGLEAARLMVENNPSQKIIILATSDGEQFARDVFHAGALGFVLKSKATHDLVCAIDAVHRGRTFFTPRFADTILQGYLSEKPGAKTAPKMSERERKTVQLLSDELAITLGHQLGGRKTFRKFAQYAIVTAAVIVTVGAGWYAFNGRVPDQVQSISDGVSASLGLKTAQPSIAGNPEIRVWVDPHTALYYCPGERAYGKTTKGRYAKQRDAQQDHFEPASRTVCE